MIETLTIDDSILTSMLGSPQVQALMPEVAQYNARYKAAGAYSGCPRCPHKAARNHEALAQLKQRLLSMPETQLRQLKNMYHTKHFVFYLQGGGGYLKQTR